MAIGIANIQKEEHRRIFGTIGVLVLLWVLVGYILYPAMKTLAVSLTVDGTFSLVRYIELLTSDTSLTVLKNSIVLGALTVVVCGIVGTLLAFLSTISPSLVKI